MMREVKFCIGRHGIGTNDMKCRGGRISSCRGAALLAHALPRSFVRRGRLCLQTRSERSARSGDLF